MQLKEITALVLTILAYCVLEASWLWGMTKPFYSRVFANVSVDGELKIRSYIALLLVYPLLLIAFYLLVLRHINRSSFLQIVGLGFLFGLVIYGTYNLTNISTLYGYTWSMVAIDTAWGAIVFATLAFIFKAILYYT